MPTSRPTSTGRWPCPPCSSQSRLPCCSPPSCSRGMLSLACETRVGAVDLALELEVAAGSCLALAGPSGAGKTSVLRAIAGLLRPAQGRVVCDGETWFDAAARIDVAPERRRCGYVFQDYALFGHLSAWRNVAYGLRDVPRARRRAEALALLERFGVAALADERPGRLSGGERQRVASWPVCCASCRSRRSSSRTTSPRRRCWATRSRCSTRAGSCSVAARPSWRPRRRPHSSPTSRVRLSCAAARVATRRASRA